MELIGTPSFDEDGREIWEEDRVLIIGIHHKKDSIAGLGHYNKNPIRILLPRGPFNSLFSYYIKDVWGLTSNSSPQLFRSTWGNPFSKCTFTHYWEGLMKSALPLGLPYFPPNLGRRIFVEAFTQGQ